MCLISTLLNRPKKVAVQSLFLPVHGDDVAVFMGLMDQMQVRLSLESREITLVLVRKEAEKFSLGDYHDLEPDAEEEVLLRLRLL